MNPAYKCPTCGKFRRTWRTQGVVVDTVAYCCEQCWKMHLEPKDFGSHSDSSDSRWKTHKNHDRNVPKPQCPRCCAPDTQITRTSSGKTHMYRRWTCSTCLYDFNQRKARKGNGHWVVTKTAIEQLALSERAAEQMEIVAA